MFLVTSLSYPTTGCMAILFPLLFIEFSRLPRGLEIPSLTFFYSPICVDLDNIQLFFIWWNFDQNNGKILPGGRFKIQHFWFIVKSRTSALMSSHKHLCAYPISFKKTLSPQKMSWYRKHLNTQCLSLIMKSNVNAQGWVIIQGSQAT